MIKTKKQSLIAIGVFVLVMLLGTISYAFFNYTRTGTVNNIRTGRIYFNSTQNGTLNLTNLFPVASSEVGNDNQIEVRVYGDTTYASGEEFLISLVDVNNTIVSGSTEKTIPVNYIASYVPTQVATGEEPNNIGLSSNDYFTDRGSTNAIYQLNTRGTVSEGEQVLVGYIPKDVKVDGTLTIKAYLDVSNIAISDTYDETSPETALNGTTTNWVNGRTLLTTSEWNTLQNTPISFKIRAEANEGTWITPPAYQVISAIQSLETIPNGRIYTGSNPDNYIWFNNEQWRIIGVINNSLKIIKATPSSSSQTFSLNGNNAYDGSDVQAYLINTYYPTINDLSKSMISENATWYVGVQTLGLTASEAYGSAIVDTWTGKIGLVSTFEYLYAAENNGTCWQTAGNYYEVSCAAKDWLWATINGGNNYTAWTLNPSDGNSVSMVSGWQGYLGNNDATYSASVSPVVYLNPSVKITGGNGQIGETNSYKIGL